MADPGRLLAAAVRSRPSRVVARGSHSCAAGTHSRTADGRLVCWEPDLPGIRYAVDAEIADQPHPEAVARRWADVPPGQFWQAWTATEVAAKLTDTPILLWLTRSGPVASAPVQTGAGLAYWTVVGHEDLVVAYGLLAPSGSLPADLGP